VVFKRFLGVFEMLAKIFIRSIVSTKTLVGDSGIKYYDQSANETEERNLKDLLTRSPCVILRPSELVEVVTKFSVGFD
jgi:hypothetical protein